MKLRRRCTFICIEGQRASKNPLVAFLPCESYEEEAKRDTKSHWSTNFVAVIRWCSLPRSQLFFVFYFRRYSIRHTYCIYTYVNYDYIRNVKLLDDFVRVACNDQVMTLKLAKEIPVLHTIRVLWKCKSISFLFGTISTRSGALCRGSISRCTGLYLPISFAHSVPKAKYPI